MVVLAIAVVAVDVADADADDIIVAANDGTPTMARRTTRAVYVHQVRGGGCDASAAAVLIVRAANC